MKSVIDSLSDQIILRTLNKSDAGELYLLIDRNRTHLREWLPWVDASTRIEHAQQFIEATQIQVDAGLGPVCGIFVNNDLQGVCGFHPYDSLSHSITLGYWLAKEFCGKNITTMCAKTLIHFAFESLRVNKVYLNAGVENWASRRIATKLNMVNEGIIREGEFLNGSYQDLVSYSLLRREWESLGEQALF
jgi:ribosomal-protein-serine acetyltransferase